jgi:hypothetical protein
MKYMILLYDNADMREIFSSRSDLIGEMDALLAELKESGELVATEPLADPVQTKTVRPADGLPVVTDGPLAEANLDFRCVYSTLFAGSLIMRAGSCS